MKDEGGRMKKKGFASDRERARRKKLGELAAKLDPAEERALAEEGLDIETWPEY